MHMITQENENLIILLGQRKRLTSKLMQISLREGQLSNSSTLSSNLFIWFMSAEATIDNAKSFADIDPLE